jgi:hypothetical protein
MQLQLLAERELDSNRIDASRRNQCQIVGWQRDGRRRQIRRDSLRASAGAGLVGACVGGGIRATLLVITRRALRMSHTGASALL